MTRFLIVALVSLIGFAIIYARPPVIDAAKPDPAPPPVRRCEGNAHCWSQGYWFERRWRQNLQRRHRALKARTLQASSGGSVFQAIRNVFGPYADQAIEVARCETGGTFSVNAQNGQYLGLFQMGSWARAHYGHSGTAYGQALAAYRYFVDSGRDWSPWGCKP